MNKQEQLYQQLVAPLWKINKQFREHLKDWSLVEDQLYWQLDVQLWGQLNKQLSDRLIEELNE